MALSYGRIREWRAADAGVLADAMSARIDALQRLEDGLRAGSAWEASWSGAHAERAARGAVTELGDTVTDLAAQAAALRRTASRVENAVEALQQDVTGAESHAARYHFAIGHDGAVATAGPCELLTAEEESDRDRARRDIEQTVSEIVAKGREIESLAARGLATATSADDGGATSVRAATGSQAGTPAPPPAEASPAAVDVWWDSLEPEERQQVIDRDPDALRNRWGIPTAVRDQLNREVLERELRLARADVESLRLSGYPTDAAVHRRDSLADLARKLEGHDTHLLQLDLHSRELPEATVAVGDPDAAHNISLTVPGYTTTLHDSMGGMIDEATRLRQDAQMLDPGRATSAIAFLGYQPPQDAVRGLTLDVAGPGHALAGGQDVATALRGLEATNGRADLTLSLFGHSYGSATSGAAAQILADQGSTPVDNLVVYGSPGIPDIDGEPEPDPFGVPRQHTYYMEAPGDRVVDGLRVVRGAGLAGLGPMPDKWGMTELSTAADPTRGTVGSIPGVDPHSIYPKGGTTAQHNLAAIASGRAEEAIHR